MHSGRVRQSSSQVILPGSLVIIIRCLSLTTELNMISSVWQDTVYVGYVIFYAECSSSYLNQSVENRAGRLVTESRSPALSFGPTPKHVFIVVFGAVCFSLAASLAPSLSLSQVCCAQLLTCLRGSCYCRKGPREEEREHFFCSQPSLNHSGSKRYLF